MALSPVPGVQEYVPAPPLAVNVVLCPAQIEAGLCVTENDEVAEKVIATV